MQLFTLKSDQNGPTWAQLGLKLGSKIDQKLVWKGSWQISTSPNLQNLKITSTWAKKLSQDPNLGPTRAQNLHMKARNSYTEVQNWHPNRPRSKPFGMTKGAQDNMKQEVDCIRLKRLCQRKLQKTIKSQETLQTNIALQAQKTWRCGGVAQAS